jgi:hypothetical protein
MRNGDFRGTAALGLSGDDVNHAPEGFPDDVIPAGEIDPSGKALLNLYPLPNADRP